MLSKNFTRLFYVALFSAFCTKATADVLFSQFEINVIAAQGPWPVVVRKDPGNELSGLAWAEKLGKSLFNDPSLSVSGSVSCQSCHRSDQGFSDGLPVAVGEKTAVRNTQGLLNVGLQRWFGWGGGADSLWAASLRPLLAEHEMGRDIPGLAAELRSKERFMIEIYDYIINDGDLSGAALKDAALKGDNLNNDNLNDTELIDDGIKGVDLINDTQLVVLAAKSIAAYTRTLQSGVTPFDKFRNALLENDVQGMGDYSIAAKRGLKLFIGEANCRVCHFGANFSNSEFHDIGLPFFTAVGQIDPGRFAGIQRIREDPFSLLGQYGVNVSANERFPTATVKQSQLNWGQWRTPSLRNLTLTAPYMHNGSLASLRDVVNWYVDINPDRLHTNGESLLKPLSLTEQQRLDLVAFLESLSVVR